MAVCDIHFGSNALQRQTAMSVIIPEQGEGPFPVLYLLHGLTDDYTGWARRTSIERYVRDYPLMVVMPDGKRGWYTDAAGDPYDAYETLIIRDIIEFIDSRFRTKASRDGRVIAGNSMGGYGALKLAMKHPHLFCAAASLSGALTVLPVFNEHPSRSKEQQIIYGDVFGNGPEDLTAISKKAVSSALPALWLDCGTEDGLLEGNRFMHSHFESLGIRHEYYENPGNHSWDYWDVTIQQALVFLRKELGLS